MTFNVSVEISDFQRGEGRFIHCFTVPEMVDKFVKAAQVYDLDARGIYENIIAAICSSDAQALVICDLFQGFIEAGYHVPVGVAVAQDNLSIVSASNRTGLMGLLRVLHWAGTDLARNTLEDMAKNEEIPKYREWAKRILSPEAGFIGG